MRLRALTIASALAFIALPARAGPPAPAAKGPKAACLAAHEEAQSLKTQKKPHAAREKFLACAKVECPTVVRKECVDQLALVEKDAPTVVLEATDEQGSAAASVKVVMDGTTVAERLTGTAVDVEPGEHVFRFERTDGKSIEQRVLVVEGDKNRKVVADFASLSPKPVPRGPDVVAPQEPKKIPVIAVVAGGVAIVALGSFGFFALSGKGEEKDAEAACGPNCKDDELSAVKRDYLIADISLGVAVVAAVVAVVLALPALTDSTKVTAGVARVSGPAPWMPRVKVRALPPRSGEAGRRPEGHPE